MDQPRALTLCNGDLVQLCNGDLVQRMPSAGSTKRRDPARLILEATLVAAFALVLKSLSARAAAPAGP